VAPINIVNILPSDNHVQTQEIDSPARVLTEETAMK